jgi:hypothetical protein
MRSRSAVIAIMAATVLLCFAAASAAQCPVVAIPQRRLNLSPADALNTPRVADRISVTIPASDKKEKISGIVACLDDIDVSPDSSNVNGGTFVITVPATATVKAGPLPPGDHRVSVKWKYEEAGAGGATTARETSDEVSTVFKPVLTEVKVVPVSKSNESYRVQLNGGGFNPGAKDDYLIVIGGVARDRCWTGGATPCTGVANVIRASMSGATTITLESVDPSDTATQAFQVCYREQSAARCSAAVADQTWGWWPIAVALAVVAALGALLWMLTRAATRIWGINFKFASLLLDKETNTYSLSKLQFYIWTSVAVFGYSYLTLCRLFIQHWNELPSIPSGLPGIIGVSAGAAVGAQVVTNMNGPQGRRQAHPERVGSDHDRGSCRGGARPVPGLDDHRRRRLFPRHRQPRSPHARPAPRRSAVDPRDLRHQRVWLSRRQDGPQRRPGH